MPFLEECRLSFTGCGVTWERWLALWNEMVFMQIPGYPDWESEVFRTVSKHFAQLLRIFSHHAKQTWLRSFGEAKALEIREHVLALDTSEWIHFLADCRLNPSKAHEDCDCHSEDDAEESRRAIHMPAFLSRILALSFWRANSSSQPGRLEKRRPLPQCLAQVLRDHVLPYAHRDNSQRFRAILAQDVDAQALLREHRPQLQATFDHLCDGEGGSSGTLSSSAAFSWMSACGVVGTWAVTNKVGPYSVAISGDSGAGSVRSELDMAHVREAFIDALPAQAAVAALERGIEGMGFRLFQEWIVRCSEFKYARLKHASITQRLRYLLENLFSNRSTESVLSEATALPSAPRFDVSTVRLAEGSDEAQFSFFVGLWNSLDLSSIPGFPVWEGAVLEILAPAIAPLLSIFAHYGRNSLAELQANSDIVCYINQQGWDQLVADANFITRSFTAHHASRIFAEAAGPSAALSFTMFVKAISLAAFQRSNVELLENHKKTAPRLLPLEQALSSFLKTNILPLARRRDLLGLRRSLQQDAGLQQMLAENTIAALEVFAAANIPTPAASAAAPASAPPPASAPLAGEDESPMEATAALALVPVDLPRDNVEEIAEKRLRYADFLKGLERAGLLSETELKLTMWQDGVNPRMSVRATGDFVTKICQSKFNVVDARQAFIDTMLADALTTRSVHLEQISDVSVALPAASLMEALIRVAMCKFESIPTLDTSRRMAALLDVTIHKLGEQEAVSRYMNDAAPARFAVDALAQAPASSAYERRRHEAWSLVWQQVQLADLPGFPVWEEVVCATMQPSFGILMSVFVFYSKRYNGTAAGPLGRLTSKGFMQFVAHCKAVTKVFPAARAHNAFNYTVTRIVVPASSPGEQQAEPESTRSLSFAKFVEAVIRFAFERANPKWERDPTGRLNANAPAYLIPVPDCIERFLHNCVLRFSHRDAAFLFSRELEQDVEAQAVLATRRSDLEDLFSSIAPSLPDETEAHQHGEARLAGASIAGAESGIGTGTGTRTDGDSSWRKWVRRRYLDVDTVVKLFQERRIFARLPNIESDSEPADSHKPNKPKPSFTEKLISYVMSDAQTFVLGGVGGGLDAEGLELAGATALNFDEFVELMARCGDIKYSVVRGLSLSQRIAAFFANLLDGSHPAEQVAALVEKRKKKVVKKKKKLSDASSSPSASSRSVGV
uniref:Uncharacterized protein n=1 Tax=Haptolina ericina TaxID=156174 RepID=A0A7S3AS85_9EUKA